MLQKSLTTTTYDAIGNMLTRGNTTYSWTLGRKLAAVDNGRKIQYFYDHTGSRTKKIVDGVATEYRMAGDLLMSETTNGQTLWFTYDSNANLFSMVTGGKHYFYQRNLQNDIIALVDESGDTVVNYTYDSWGKVLSITGSRKDTIGQLNPFRYRGYYYDKETGMYYLKNRYYDPELRRFICADGVMISSENIDTYNLYVYCGNNSINYCDPSGHFLESIINGIRDFVQNIQSLMSWARPAYTAAGGAIVSDGPLPIGDLFGSIIGIATTAAVAVGGLYLTVTGRNKTAEKAQVVTPELKKEKKYNYWTADLINGNKVMVGGIPLTVEQASMRVAKRESIMCRNQNAARYILFINGYFNHTNPEQHNGGFMHYHPTRNHTGYCSTHIWYFE